MVATSYGIYSLIVVRTSAGLFLDFMVDMNFRESRPQNQNRFLETAQNLNACHHD